jgi:hypothetical protein
MMKQEKFYQPEFIESYLRGFADKADKDTMEKLLQADADLRAEVNFQKDLLDAIAQSRRNDLKQLLQNTPVPAFQPFYQTPVFQITAVVVAVATFVAIWVLNLPSENKDLKNRAITEPKTEKIENLAQNKTEESKTEDKNAIQNTDSQKTAPEPKKELKAISPKKETAEKNPILNREIFYQYDGNKVLQLFGNFSYELLEKVDVGAGEKTYIYIQNQFYELVPTAPDEVRNLKESIVTDKEQIKLLLEKLPKK